MAVPPLGPGGTPPPTPPGPIPLPPLDSLSQSSGVQVLGTDGKPITNLKDVPSALEIRKIIDTAILEFERILRESFDIDFRLLHNLFLGVAAAAKTIGNARESLDSVLADWETASTLQQAAIEEFNNAVDEFNDGINDSLTSDQLEIQLINQAIQDFNDGNITQSQYRNAADRYNDFMQARNLEIQNLDNTFNAAVVEFNGKIDQFNQDNQDILDRLGTITVSPPPPIFDPQQTVTTSTYPLVDRDVTPPPDIPAVQDPGISGNVTEIGDVVPDPNREQVFSQGFEPVVFNLKLFFNFLTQFDEFVTNDIEDQLAFGGAGRGVTFPEALIAQSPNVFFQFIGQGSGVGIASLITGLNSSSLERILGESMFLTTLRELQIPLPPRVVDALQLFTLQLLLNTAFLGAMPAARLLSHQLSVMDPSSPAFKTATALAITQQILGLVTTNIIESSIAQILKGELDPNTPKEQIDELVKQLASGIKLTLSQLALALIGKTTGLPGLTPQFFSNLGFSTVDILTALNAGGRLSNVLESPLSLLSLKNNLSDRLVLERGFTSEQAAKLVNDAMNSVTEQGPFLSLADLRDALTSAFDNQGLSRLEAGILTNDALFQIRGDIANPFLNVPFTLNFEQGLLTKPLINLLVDLGFAPNAAGTKINNAIRRTLDIEDLQTQRGFRNQLIQDLKGEGIPLSQAIFIANQAVQFLLTGNVGPLTGISKERLNQLQEALIAQFGETTVKDAIEKAKGPFSTEDEFLLILKEELGIIVGANFSVEDFDKAVSALPREAAAGLIPRAEEAFLGLAALFETVRDSIKNRLTPDLGATLADEITNKTVIALFGTSSIDEVRDRENLDPKSLLNIIRDQLEKLGILDDERKKRERIDVIRDTSEHNTAFNALLNNVLRPPGEFIGSVSFGGGKRSIASLGSV